MRIFPFVLAVVAFFPTISTSGEEPTDSSPESNLPASSQMSQQATSPMQAVPTATRFAPFWIPIARFMPPSPGENALPPPSAAFALIWQPQWQEELALSAEQKKTLQEIHAKAVAKIKERSEQFKSLPPEGQKAQLAAQVGKPAPWRQQLDNNLRSEIKAILTPKQLQVIKEFSFPSQAVGLLYQAKIRQSIEFTREQEDAFRRIAGERLARLQATQIEQAEKLWGLLTPEQQAALPELVRKQAPASAILSIAMELGFDLDRCLPGHPMLSESPVRERLKLSDVQKEHLEALATDCAAKKEDARRERLARQVQPAPSGSHWEAEAKAKVEAILTPPQLMTLNAIDFRRQVALTLGRPDKRQAIGIAAQQAADFQQLAEELHDRQYRIDREMLARALEILTPRQQEQLQEETDRRAGG